VPMSRAASNSGSGQMPNTMVAAAKAIATTATYGCARADASGDQPVTGLTRRRGSVGHSTS
jgi:hypothetical protein